MAERSEVTLLRHFCQDIPLAIVLKHDRVDVQLSRALKSMGGIRVIPSYEDLTFYFCMAYKQKVNFS